MMYEYNNEEIKVSKSLWAFVAIWCGRAESIVVKVIGLSLAREQIITLINADSL